MWYCLFLTILQNEIQDFSLSFELVALLGVKGLMSIKQTLHLMQNKIQWDCRYLYPNLTSRDHSLQKTWSPQLQVLHMDHLQGKLVLKVEGKHAFQS